MSVDHIFGKTRRISADARSGLRTFGPKRQGYMLADLRLRTAYRAEGPQARTARPR